MLFITPIFITSIFFIMIAFGVFALFRKKPVRSGEAIVLQNPKLGMLDLSGQKYAKELQIDRSRIQGIFSSAEVSQGENIPCDVLFIYGDLGGDGKFLGYQKSLREIIRDAKAVVAVVATGNNVEAYIQAGKKEAYGHANLVMTLERNGESFPDFFQALFGKMGKGKSMPIAWVELAPQGPGGGGSNTPGTIFSAEIGQIQFLVSE